MSSHSTLVRLAPIALSEIPPHPDLPTRPDKSAAKSSSSEDVSQPDLLPFLTTFLRDGLSFLSSSSLSSNFKHHSVKQAPPSTNNVEVLTYSIPASTLESAPWSSSTHNNSDANGSHSSQVVTRAQPKPVPTEHWFARRSVHSNISSKNISKPGHASWEEFIYGLRDNHSKHEEDFTPTVYDARHVVDWAGQVRKLDEEGSLQREGFRNVTMSIYEMCHKIPPPLNNRCFGVLVVTGTVLGSASAGGSSSATSQKGWFEEGEKEKFVAVTVPIQLGSGVKKAFYANGRNLKEGDSAIRKQEVVQALYCAVETGTLRQKTNGEGEEVEWVMATASDAKGNLPMFIQKMALPGAVPKDVSFFMKWIKTVDEKEVEGVVSPS